MSEYIAVGMTLYHKTEKIPGTVSQIQDGIIIFNLSRELCGLKSLKLPIKHIGEWLFYDINDMKLSLVELAALPQYLQYGNPKLLTAKEEYEINQKKIIAMEEENAVARQKQIEQIEQFRIEKVKLHEVEMKKQEEIKREEIVNFKRVTQEKHEFIKHLNATYGFDGFYHYTDFQNAICILSEGHLLCRERAGISGFLDSANKNVIENTNDVIFKYVRLYYKEKTPTIYDSEGIKVDNKSPHMPIPVVLLFNKDIFYHDNVGYTSGCGGSKHSVKTKSFDQMKNFDWNTIFDRNPIHPDLDSILTLGYDARKSKIINKRNAEFLYYGSLSTDEICKIIFRCQADLKHATCMSGENRMYMIDESKFNNHRNYLTDYSITIDNNMATFNLDFLNDPSLYMHQVNFIHNDMDSVLINLDSGLVEIKFLSSNNRLNSKMNFAIIYPKMESVSQIEYLMNGHISAVIKNS